MSYLNIEQIINEISIYEQDISLIISNIQDLSHKMKDASEGISKTSKILAKDAINPSSSIPGSPTTKLMLAFCLFVGSKVIDVANHEYKAIKERELQNSIIAKKKELVSIKLPLLYKIIPKIKSIHKQLQLAIISDARLCLLALDYSRHRLVANNLSMNFESYCKISRLKTFTHCAISYLNSLNASDNRLGDMRQFRVPSEAYVREKDIDFLYCASNICKIHNMEVFAEQFNEGQYLLVRLFNYSAQLNENIEFVGDLSKIINFISESKVNGINSNCNASILYYNYLKHIPWIQQTTNDLIYNENKRQAYAETIRSLKYYVKLFSYLLLICMLFYYLL